MEIESKGEGNSGEGWLQVKKKEKEPQNIITRGVERGRERVSVAKVRLNFRVKKKD